MAHEAVANGDFVRLKQLHIQQLRFGQLSRGTLLCSHLYIILDLFSMGVPGWGIEEVGIAMEFVGMG